MTKTVILYGDPHGEWEPLLRECAKKPPEAVIILGNLGLRMPLHKQLRPIFDSGILVTWIAGTNDNDSEAHHDFLWGDNPEGNLHVASRQFGRLRIGGVGGLAKGFLRYPRTGPIEPMRGSRQRYLQELNIKKPMARRITIVDAKLDIS